MPELVGLLTKNVYKHGPWGTPVEEIMSRNTIINITSTRQRCTLDEVPV